RRDRVHPRLLGRDDVADVVTLAGEGAPKCARVEAAACEELEEVPQLPLVLRPHSDDLTERLVARGGEQRGRDLALNWANPAERQDGLERQLCGSAIDSRLDRLTPGPRELNRLVWSRPQGR